MLTGKAILDAAASHIHDSSTTMRARLLSWLGTAFQQAYAERDWRCLIASASLTIVANAVTKPATYGRFVSAKGTDWFFTEDARLTDEEIAALSAGTSPAGFEETSTSVVFQPGATGSVTLKYVRTVPTPADDAIETVWPDEFLPLFERTLLTVYYEFDVDERGLSSVQLDQKELDRLKALDNRQKAIPKRSRYIR